MKNGQFLSQYKRLHLTLWKIQVYFASDWGFILHSVAKKQSAKIFTMAKKTPKAIRASVATSRPATRKRAIKTLQTLMGISQCS